MHANGLVDAVLGGAIYGLGTEFRHPDLELAEKGEQIDFEELLRPAAEAALRRVHEAARESERELGAFTEHLMEEGGGRES
jgi:hypothetical protein